MKSDAIVIIPTYNEKENIENIIRAIFALEKKFDILIVDDGSPDGTYDIANKLSKEFPDGLYTFNRESKQGLGSAYIWGFNFALLRGYEYIFEMDADFSHNPKDLMKLYDACSKNGADVAIGSRYKSGVNVVNWPMGRVLMSYFASKYVQLITGLKICDTTAGFICYRSKVLITIDIDTIQFVGYAFQIEMKYTAYKCGFNLQEVPIVFVNRELGTSKMSGSIFKEAVWGVLMLRLKSFFKKYPNKNDGIVRVFKP